jgi:hypothetical protein
MSFFLKRGPNNYLIQVRLKAKMKIKV